MSSQDRLENVLRDIHVMISKSEVYDTDRIIVSKQDMFNLIDRLNASIYEIMDEYELTQQSRDRALREKKKEGDRIIWDASRQAEDIYAASVLYTEEALNHLNVMIDEADATVDRMYREFCRNIKQQQETIRENQLELKSQLQLLADTEKYLRLIEERNREIERERAEKKGRKTLENFGEKHTVIKPEIKINEEYFRKAGIPFEKEEEKQPDEEMMQPLEDEGVIESTLKKAAADIQQIFAEEPKKIFGKKSAESESEQEAGTGAQKEIVSEGNAESNRQTEVESAHKEAAQKQMTKASLDERTAYDDKDEKEKYTAEEIEEAKGGYTEQEIAEAKNYKSEALQESAVLDEAEIKVNLDAEYFKQNGSEEEGTKQHRERMSLLDKLMGKKKTLL